MLLTSRSFPTLNPMIPFCSLSYFCENCWMACHSMPVFLRAISIAITQPTIGYHGGPGGKFLGFLVSQYRYKIPMIMKHIPGM